MSNAQKLSDFNRSSEPISGKFRRVGLDPLDRAGQFSGKGSLSLTREGLALNGRHVLSLGTRWGIGLGLFFGSLILSLGLTGGNFYFAPGVIPIIFLVNYLILKREKLLIPFENINRIGGDPKGSLVGVEFDEDPFRNSAVFHTPEWSSIFLALREATWAGEDSTVLISEIDEKYLEGGVVQVKPWSKSKVVIFSALVGFLWYLLFFVLNSFIFQGIYALMGIPDMLSIRNIFIRLINWILFFGIPAVPTYFLSRKYFRNRLSRVPKN